MGISNSEHITRIGLFYSRTTRVKAKMLLNIENVLFIKKLKKKWTQIHMNKLKSYLQSTSRNMWSTEYYSRNELCLIRMEFFWFFYFASSLYNCNLQFMSTNWRQRYTHIKLTYIWKFFYSIIYILLYFFI
jgi:hypothetical protein